MHKIPASAVSSVSNTAGGATVIGRGPKSSSNNPVTSAPACASALSMLAATARLTSSAISATVSAARTLRHTSTAFFAPAINSFGAFPKVIPIILPKFLALPIPSSSLPLHFLLPLHSKRRYLTASARHIRQSGPAILIARLQHQFLLLLLHMCQQFNRLSAIIRLHILHHPRPRNVSLHKLPLLCGKQPRILSIRQHRKKRLHMRYLAAKIIRHAHHARRVRFHQRFALLGLRHNVVDQHPPVHQIDLFPVRREPLPVKLQLPRVRQYHRNLHPLKSRLQYLEFAPRRHFLPIHNRHLRTLRRSSPLDIRRKQRVQ